jgi:hypothetical protein
MHAVVPDRSKSNRDQGGYGCSAKGAHIRAAAARHPNCSNLRGASKKVSHSCGPNKGQHSLTRAVVRMRTSYKKKIVEIQPIQALLSSLLMNNGKLRVPCAVDSQASKLGRELVWPQQPQRRTIAL